MSTFRTKISENAKRDIRRIYDYLEEYKAKKAIEQIYADIENIKFMPYANKTLYSFKEPNVEYRRAMSGKYVIVYEIIGNKITIGRIFNQNQNYLNSKGFILKEESNLYKVSN